MQKIALILRQDQKKSPELSVVRMPKNQSETDTEQRIRDGRRVPKPNNLDNICTTFEVTANLPLLVAVNINELAVEETTAGDQISFLAAADSKQSCLPLPSRPGFFISGNQKWIEMTNAAQPHIVPQVKLLQIFLVSLDFIDFCSEGFVSSQHSAPVETISNVLCETVTAACIESGKSDMLTEGKNGIQELGVLWKVTDITMKLSQLSLQSLMQALQQTLCDVEKLTLVLNSLEMHHEAELLELLKVAKVVFPDLQTVELTEGDATHDSCNSSTLARFIDWFSMLAPNVHISGFKNSLVSLSILPCWPHSRRDLRHLAHRPSHHQSANEQQSDKPLTRRSLQEKVTCWHSMRQFMSHYSSYNAHQKLSSSSPGESLFSSRFGKQFLQLDQQESIKVDSLGNPLNELRIDPLMHVPSHVTRAPSNPILLAPKQNQQHKNPFSSLVIQSQSRKFGDATRHSSKEDRKEQKLSHTFTLPFVKPSNSPTSSDSPNLSPWEGNVISMNPLLNQQANDYNQNLSSQGLVASDKAQNCQPPPFELSSSSPNETQPPQNQLFSADVHDSQHENIVENHEKIRFESDEHKLKFKWPFISGPSIDAILMAAENCCVQQFGLMEDRSTVIAGNSQDSALTDRERLRIASFASKYPNTSLAFSSFCGLKALTITKTSLKCFPLEFLMLAPSLETIDLSHNQLISFLQISAGVSVLNPKLILGAWKLLGHTLKVLNLSCNSLADLPVGIVMLASLSSLNVSKNQFRPKFTHPMTLLETSEGPAWQEVLPCQVRVGQSAHHIKLALPANETEENVQDENHLEVVGVRGEDLPSGSAQRCVENTVVHGLDQLLKNAPCAEELLRLMKWSNHELNVYQTEFGENWGKASQEIRMEGSLSHAESIQRIAHRVDNFWRVLFGRKPLAYDDRVLQSTVATNAGSDLSDSCSESSDDEEDIVQSLPGLSSEHYLQTSEAIDMRNEQSLNDRPAIHKLSPPKTSSFIMELYKKLVPGTVHVDAVLAMIVPKSSSGLARLLEPKSFRHRFNDTKPLSFSNSPGGSTIRNLLSADITVSLREPANNCHGFINLNSSNLSCSWSNPSVMMGSRSRLMCSLGALHNSFGVSEHSQLYNNNIRAAIGFVDQTSLNARDLFRMCCQALMPMSQLLECTGVAIVKKIGVLHKSQIHHASIVSNVLDIWKRNLRSAMGDPSLPVKLLATCTPPDLLHVYRSKENAIRRQGTSESDIAKFSEKFPDTLESCFISTQNGWLELSEDSAQQELLRKEDVRAAFIESVCSCIWAAAMVEILAKLCNSQRLKHLTCAAEAFACIFMDGQVAKYVVQSMANVDFACVENVILQQISHTLGCFSCENSDQSNGEKESAQGSDSCSALFNFEEDLKIKSSIKQDLFHQINPSKLSKQTEDNIAHIHLKQGIMNLISPFRHLTPVTSTLLSVPSMINGSANLKLSTWKESFSLSQQSLLNLCDSGPLRLLPINVTQLKLREENFSSSNTERFEFHTLSIGDLVSTPSKSNNNTKANRNVPTVHITSSNAAKSPIYESSQRAIDLPKVAFPHGVAVQPKSKHEIEVDESKRSQILQPAKCLQPEFQSKSEAYSEKQKSPSAGQASDLGKNSAPIINSISKEEEAGMQAIAKKGLVVQIDTQQSEQVSSKESKTIGAVGKDRENDFLHTNLSAEWSPRNQDVDDIGSDSEAELHIPNMRDATFEATHLRYQMQNAGLQQSNYEPGFGRWMMFPNGDLIDKILQTSKSQAQKDVHDSHDVPYFLDFMDQHQSPKNSSPGVVASSHMKPQNLDATRKNRGISQQASPSKRSQSAKEPRSSGGRWKGHLRWAPLANSRGLEDQNNFTTTDDRDHVGLISSGTHNSGNDSPLFQVTSYTLANSFNRPVSTTYDAQAMASNSRQFFVDDTEMGISGSQNVPSSSPQSAKKLEADASFFTSRPLSAASKLRNEPRRFSHLEAPSTRVKENFAAIPSNPQLVTASGSSQKMQSVATMQLTASQPRKSSSMEKRNSFGNAKSKEIRLQIARRKALGLSYGQPHTPQKQNQGHGPPRLSSSRRREGSISGPLTTPSKGVVASPLHFKSPSIARFKFERTIQTGESKPDNSVTGLQDFQQQGNESSFGFMAGHSRLRDESAPSPIDYDAVANSALQHVKISSSPQVGRTTKRVNLDSSIESVATGTPPGSLHNRIRPSVDSQPSSPDGKSTLMSHGNNSTKPHSRLRAIMSRTADAGPAISHKNNVLPKHRPPGILPDSPVQVPGSPTVGSWESNAEW